MIWVLLVLTLRPCAAIPVPPFWPLERERERERDFISKYCCYGRYVDSSRAR